MEEFVKVGPVRDLLRGWIGGLDEDQKAVNNNREPIRQNFMQGVSFCATHLFKCLKGSGVSSLRSLREASEKDKPFLQTGCGSSFPENNFAGRVFCNVISQLSAPQRLKGAAASIQCIKLCEFGMFAPQIAPLDFVGGHPGIFFHK
jgi:hypothetical protein